MKEGMRLEFICMNPDAEYAADQIWRGNVRCIEKTGNTIIAQITGKGSQMTAVIGEYPYGNYICIPDWGIGSPLAALDDRFWNRERLERYLSQADAITISEALNVIHKEGMA